MISQLNRLGVEPQGIEQPLDLNIPENKIMLAFYLASPEVENDRRALNTFVGMRRAKKEGRWVSSAPKGYSNTRDDHSKKVISLNEDAPIVKWCFEELAKGIYPVADVWRMAIAKGFKYSKANFWQLIRNPVYCGLIRLPAYKEEGETLVKGSHPAIITEDLFFQVQDLLDGRKRNVPTKNTRNEELPLRGFLSCPRCGKKLSGSASKGYTARYFYYHCYPGCKERVQAQKVNEAFVNLLRSITFNQDAIDLYKKLAEQVFRGNQLDHSHRSKQIKSEMEKQRQRANKAQQLMLDGEMKMDEYREVKNKTEAEIDRMMRNYMQLSVQDSDYKQYVDFGYDILKNLMYYYTEGNVTTKQAIVSSIFSEKLVFEQNRLRTTKVILAVADICPQIKELWGYKNETGNQIGSLSSMVAGTRFELVTFGL